MIKNILTNKNVQKIFFRNYFYAIKKLNSSQGCSVRPAEFLFPLLAVTISFGRRQRQKYGQGDLQRSGADRGRVYPLPQGGRPCDEHAVSSMVRLEERSEGRTEISV